MTSMVTVRGVSTSIPIVEQSQVGEARRATASACRSLDFSETDAGRAGIAVSEAATNVLRHGGGGEILLRTMASDDARGLEILALDRGPGIADMALALEDGHSTAGTRGNGVGAMRRAATRFDAYSIAGRGAAFLMEVWGSPPARSPIEVGVVCVAMAGEEVCGDAWDVACATAGTRGRVIVADGLGHGPLAREAAMAALEAARISPGLPSRALEDAHLAARGTRGAAVSVAEVDLQELLVRYAGFGNVAAALVAHDQTRKLVSMNGTIGQGTLKAREFNYPFAVGTLLILHSDGLGSHWSLDEYPGLLRKAPALVAGVLYRDHSRRRDDVAVVVARLGGLA